MTKTRGITLGKFEKNAINEDAVITRGNMIAISDGAGGGGLFADRWSKYLIKNLPSAPMMYAEKLDEWIGSIWESYYNRAEESAKKLGGMVLDKFYDEGSFATLAAVWKQNDGRCRWMAYGDTVVFHYDCSTKILTHSFTSLADFDRAPFLINCKDELDYDGFRSGTFQLNKESVIFIASDALAHYIMMMYELSHIELFNGDIEKAENEVSKNSNVIIRAKSIPVTDFEDGVIKKLRKSVYNPNLYAKWLSSLIEKGLLAHDDYSLAIMYE